MSVAVGHALGGYAVAEAAPVLPFDAWWRALLFAGVVANLPDLDFVPGLLVGDADRWHHGPSHSLVAAVVVGVLGGLWLWRRRRRGGAGGGGAHGTRGGGGRAGGFWRGFVLVSAVYASHVLLDAVTPERAGTQAGVALLWPWTAERISAPVPMPDWLFHAIALQGDDAPAGFVAMLFSRDMLVALGAEALLFAPLLVFGLMVRAARSR